MPTLGHPNMHSGGCAAIVLLSLPDVRSVYEVTPAAFVWAGLVGSLALDASHRGRSTKSREISHALAPRKAAYMTLGDARGSRLFA